MKWIEDLKIKLEIRKEEKPYTKRELMLIVEEQEREIEKLRCKYNTVNLKYLELINNKQSLLKCIEELETKQCKKKKKD